MQIAELQPTRKLAKLKKLVDANWPGMKVTVLARVLTVTAFI